MELRWYQAEAIQAIYDYFETKSGNPIVAVPTAGGKSVIIAEFLRSAFAAYPGQKVLMVTHIKELLGQNLAELQGIWPTAPAGVYSAGLGRKEVRPITFAGIASVVDKAHLFGRVDLVLIDECHLVGPADDTNYRSFLTELTQLNPALKVIGFTATPFRLGQGMLTDTIKGKKGETLPPLFTDICYDLCGVDPFNRLVAEGYLCKLIPKRTTEEIKLTNVKMVAGEYNLNDLQAAVDKDSISKAACAEMIHHAKLGTPEERKRWLVFATGIEHSEHVAEILRDQGIDARAIHSKMDETDRDKWIAAFKKEDGIVRCLVNNNVLTTGHNFKLCDLIGMLRPTASPGLWVQMLGRGTRSHPGKSDTLVLDFAGNTKRLGPINDPVVPRKKGGKGGGTAPVKLCEHCDTYNHTSVRFCTNCGEEFPKTVKIVGVAASAELVRGEEPVIEVFPVRTLTYQPHFPRDVVKPPSLKVSYFSGPIQMFSEWVCLEHAGWAGHKAREWWHRRCNLPPPTTIEEAMKMVNVLDRPTHIRVWVNQRHPQIMAHDFTGTAFGTQERATAPAELYVEEPPSF